MDNIGTFDSLGYFDGHLYATINEYFWAKSDWFFQTIRKFYD